MKNNRIRKLFLSIELFWYNNSKVEVYSRTERTIDNYKVIEILLLEKKFELRELKPRSREDLVLINSTHLLNERFEENMTL